MTTFTDLLEAESGDTVETVAAGIAHALKLSKTQRDVLYSLIVDQVRRTWRNDVRSLEPSRFTRRAERAEFAGEEADPAAHRSTYLAKRFATFAGKWVTWGEATIDDHAARIESLNAQIRGTQRTIDDHADAIERIKATPGAGCLNDVEAAGCAA